MTAVDGKHIYNGTLPSASEILRVFSFGEFPNMEKMEEAAFIGTAVHETIASILNQEEGLIIDDMMMSDVRFSNCIKAFQEWQRSGYPVEPVVIEKAFASTKYGFGGTIDFVGLEGDEGEIVLKDWKTGQTRYKDFVQLELYAMLLKECTGLVAKDLCLVYLNKETGEYKERRCPDRQKLRTFTKRVLKFWKETEEFKKLVDGRRRIEI